MSQVRRMTKESDHGLPSGSIYEVGISSVAFLLVLYGIDH